MCLINPSHKAKPHENLWLFSMGKRFRITAVFTTDAEANTHMETHKDEAVIACFGPFIFLAENYTGEKS